MKRFAAALMVSLALSATPAQSAEPAPPDTQTMVARARTFAEQGDAKAQFAMYLLYRTGAGVPKDPKEARAWLVRAVEQKHPEAMLAFAQAYLDLDEYERAAKWLREAAAAGNADARVKLGLMHYTGQGVPLDKKRALVLIREAAHQEHSGAQWMMGTLYLEGGAVKRDPTKAFEWFNKAAAQGDPEAQGRLGEMYYAGTGVAKDKHQALAWTRKAADARVARSQVLMGMLHEAGDVVPRDDKGAVTWYTKAAAQGHAVGQERLASMYARGLGVPRSYETAYMWYLLSSAQGNKSAATARDAIESMLTPQQRERAQSAARAAAPSTL